MPHLVGEERLVVDSIDQVNAVMESFWSTLKLELIHQSQFQTRSQASCAIFDYIETFYKPKRIHSTLNYRSPIDFESQKQ